MAATVANSHGEMRPVDLVAKSYSRLAVSLLVPVSITVWVVVWAVLNLTPLYSGGSSSPLFLVKNENNSQSDGAKFGDSIVNALVVVAAITVMTFVIVLLYKCGCTKILVGWFVISAALTFFFLTWILLDLVFTRYQIAYDFVTMSFVIWNFGVVGLFSLFYHGNKVLSQLYLVVLSVIMSWVLTRLPEWSTWSILVLVAIYDVIAVLCPGGPLKMLLKAAHERNEPIPGFIYDSDHRADPLLRDDHKERAQARNINMSVNKNKKKRNEEKCSEAKNSADGTGAATDGDNIPNVTPLLGNDAVPLSVVSPTEGRAPPDGFAPPIIHQGVIVADQGTELNPPPLHREDSQQEEEVGSGPSAIVISVSHSTMNSSPNSAVALRSVIMHDGTFVDDVRRVPKTNSLSITKAKNERANGTMGVNRSGSESEEDEEEDPFDSAHEARPFKLGLGDFIFYSLLCGRAATASYVAWTSAYVAVTMGLVGTLTSLLFFRGKIPALPALPISIFLGVAINFLGRYVMSDYCLFSIQYGLGL